MGHNHRREATGLGSWCSTIELHPQMGVEDVATWRVSVENKLSFQYHLLQFSSNQDTPFPGR